MNTDCIIQTKALSKRYHNTATCAVNSISLEIESGSFFGLLGPNGSGKTTFISILCGLLTPSTGEAFVCQHNIKFMRPIKPLIGLVPQKIALYPTLTLKENLRYFASLYNLTHQTATKKINEYLCLFELEAVADKLVNTLSGGMLRRANLAASILHEPQLLFLDEPTANVDAHARSAIFANLLELHSRGVTIVYTTHYMEEVETLCSRIAILKSGNIVADDSLAHFKNHYPEKASFTEIYLSLTE